MLEVGLEFKLDQKYKDKKAIRNAVQGIYNKVKASPERYGISQEVVQLVADAAAHRNMVGTAKEINQTESQIEGGTIKELITGVRDKSLRLLDIKLTRASKSKKALDAIPLQALSVVAGTMFDKAQILQGLATEHIAVMGKIDGNIDPKDALDLIQKLREKNVQENTKK